VKPEEALRAARDAAARRRAGGDYADEPPALQVTTADGLSLERLLEWATIEPDPALVYSTRRFGAPITLVKRGLVRALRQHLVQIVGQQSRFNVQLVAHVSQLAERVERLEEAAAATRRMEPPLTPPS